MHSLLGVIVVATLAFIGTMFDNFFAFAAQLALTERSRFTRVSAAQALGVATLIVLAGASGSLSIGSRCAWIGLLCVAPWALGRAWVAQPRHARPRTVPARRPHHVHHVARPRRRQPRRVDPAACAPTARSMRRSRSRVFARGRSVFIFAAQALASHPRVVAWGTRYGRALIPGIYLGLGVLILIECGTFG